MIYLKSDYYCKYLDKCGKGKRINYYEEILEHFPCPECTHLAKEDTYLDDVIIPMWSHILAERRSVLEAQEERVRSQKANERQFYTKAMKLNALRPAPSGRMQALLQRMKSSKHRTGTGIYIIIGDLKPTGQKVSVPRHGKKVIHKDKANQEWVCVYRKWWRFPHEIK